MDKAQRQNDKLGSNITLSGIKFGEMLLDAPWIIYRKKGLIKMIPLI